VPELRARVSNELYQRFKTSVELRRKNQRYASVLPLRLSDALRWAVTDWVETTEQEFANEKQYGAKALESIMNMKGK
jgi:hypothetical protein